MLIGFLIFAGILAGLWILNTVIDKGTDAAARAVFHKSYQADRAEMHRGLSFRAPVARDRLAAAIVDKVNAHAEAPALAGGLYLAQRSDDLLVFAVGNKMSTSFRARVDLKSTDEGSRGTFRLVDWHESGATVIGHDRIAPLIKRISIAVTELGGSVEETQHA